MTWDQLDPKIRTIAETVLTPGQLEVFRLALEYPEGQRFRPLAFRLDLPRTTVIDRYDAAHRRLRKAGVYVTEHGTYHQRETA